MTSLACLVLGHAPETMIVSNGGYRFSHCRRCGVEIVQSVVSGWRVPQKGFKITWRSDQRPSAERAPSAASQHPASPPPEPPPAPLPFAAAQPILHVTPPDTPPSDFMGSDTGGFDWMDAQDGLGAPQSIASDARRHPAPKRANP